MCMVWGVSEGRVQQGDSCREKAVPGSAGPCPEAPEAPPGGQEVKQSMVRVRGVLKNAASSTYTAFPLDVLNSRKWCPCDALGSFHHPLQCFAVSHRAVSIPDCDAAGQDALDRTPVKVHHYG